MRQVIAVEPQSQSEWENLPIEFHQYLDEIDEARNNADSKQVINHLYPNYKYSWDVDSSIPFGIIIHHWNHIDLPLPEPEKVVNQICNALEEASYDDWGFSTYSY